MSNTALLRATRSHLIGQMPDLGPALEHDDYAIQSELTRYLMEKGVQDPEAAVSDIDRNKVERTAISGFFIREQRNFLVSGNGRAAHFIPHPGLPLNFEGGGHPQSFAPDPLPDDEDLDSIGDFGDLVSSLSFGAGVVESRYKNPADTTHNWWDSADNHYFELGRRAIWLGELGGRKKPTREALFLRDALKSVALSSVLPSYFRFIRQQVDATDERLRAAHDMSHLATLLASIHSLELADPHTRKPDRMLLTVERDSHGTYKARQVHKPGVRGPYSKIAASELPSSTLKCAAHARVDGDPTALEDFVHASINIAPNYNLL